MFITCGNNISSVPECDQERLQLEKISPSVLDIQIYSMCAKLSTQYRWKHTSKVTAIHQGMKGNKAFITEATKTGKR